MTWQNEQQASDLHGHLPECPVPEMQAGHGPLHPDDAQANCICDRLRACEQRVRMEDDDYAYVSAQAEADGRRRGWVEALDAARDAVETVWTDDPSWDGTNWNNALCEALAAIDALRYQPADQTGYNLPDAP